MILGIDASRANLEKKTGTEWYSFFLIQNLKKIIPKNINVILYSKKPLKNGLEIMPDNWRSAVLKWPPKFLWTQIRLSWEMFKKNTKPDILFISAHTIPIIHPFKTISVIHDLGFQHSPNLYSKKELWYHNWSLKFAIKHAKKIITISNFTKQEILKYFSYPSDNIKVIYNACDQEKYFKLNDQEKKLKKDILNKYQINSAYLLYIGRIEFKKNINKLIKAFYLLKKNFIIKEKLVLIGGQGNGYSQIIDLIHQYSLEKDVIITGYVSQEEMNYFMNYAELFVFPSLYEGFGIPILEAMSAGTPIVCSDIEALREVGNNAVVYFDPNNEYDMAEKIDQLIKNENLQKQLIINGFERIKNFSWEKCAFDTWEVLKNEF